MEEAGVGGIQQPESIPAWLYLEIRKDPAIADDCVAVEFRHERRAWTVADRVQQLAVTIEGAVVEYNGNIERAAWQIESLFRRVCDDVSAEQARENVETGDAHRMVVIPKS